MPLPLRLLSMLLATTVLGLADETADRSFSEREVRHETVLIEDALAGSTLGERVGGELGAEGFRPGLGFNYILYRPPGPLTDGYAEFEIKGMDPAAVPAGSDHGFLAIYDGRGISEPAAYFEDFKGNFFRWNVHWRQNRAAIKAVISCAAPTAERREAARAVFPAERDWTLEPTGLAYPFSPDKWHRVRVEWRERVFLVLIDDSEVWRATGPHAYAPVEPRIRLGSAPGTRDEAKVKYACTLDQLQIRRFRLVAFAGAGSGPSGSGSP